MSSNTTPMEVGILFVEFSAIPDSEKQRFLQQHPELRSAWVVDWALTAAQLRGRMGELEARRRIARAALYIATEMGDHERQAAARKLLAGPVDEDHEQQTTTRTSDDQSPRSRRTPKWAKALIASAAESVSKAFTVEVCNLLIAVISAGSEHAARQIVRGQMWLALQSEFLPALMQVRDLYNRSPEPAPNLDAFCGLILDEVKRALAEMEPQAVGVGGVCLALILADSPKALESVIARYRPLIDQTLFNKLERMSESFEARGLPEFATQTRLRAEWIRGYLNAPDEGLRTPTLDPQGLALLRVSFATTEEEAWAIVEEEPGLLSNEAVLQIRAQAAFLQMQGNPVWAQRLQKVADWLTRWRSELADSAHNIVSQLADQVVAGELAMDVALAKLETPGALTDLSILHLGAVDERVIELRMQNLHKAEILAVLNDAAARRVGGAKIRAYTAISLAELRILQGDVKGALQLLDDVIEQARRATDLWVELRALGVQGMAYQQLGQFRAAAASYRNAQGLVRQIGSTADQLPILSNLAHIYSVLGDMDQALACAQEGREIARRLGDRKSEATFLGVMAALLERTGQFPEAAKQLELAVEIFRELGDRDNEARTLGNLGSVYLDLGKLQQARQSIIESLILGQSMGMRSVEMKAWGGLGDIALMEGQLQQAIDHFRKSLEIAEEISDRQAEAMTLNNLGVIHTRLNQWDQAERYLEGATEIARQIGDRRLEGQALLNRGNNYGSRRLWISAIDNYNAALNIAREVGDRRLEAQALGSLGRAYEHTGYLQAALNEYEQVLRLNREMEDRRGEALTLHNMGNTYAALGQHDQAFAYYNQALSIARDLANPDHVARIRAARGHTYLRMGRYAEAREEYRSSIDYIEKTRSGLLEEEHRLGYFGWDKMTVYGSLILLLADPDRCYNPREALETVERSRSRTFLDQLAYTDLPAPRGVDPDLLTRERELAMLLREQGVAMRQAKTEERRQELATQIAKTQSEWEDVLSWMQEPAREYVALRRGEPTKWREIQALLQTPAI